ncbi:sulfotransferase family 2 domain-containing protein [Methyloligella solikamskensis]|uniref:Sulfotransferase family 2 domain-containing protein n=1 Tax=Methyloligella solikamskensis TaxID=1177756 RepID=A0ABW3JB46_9HYPH
MQKSFFLHIPKCAGMSVWTTLWDIHGFNNVFQIGTHQQFDEFKTMPMARKDALGAFGGHGFLNEILQYTGDISDRYKFTTFRDPVDRVVSEYHFTRSCEKHFRYDEIQTMDIVEFAELPDLRNLQTRLLTGAEDPDAAIEMLGFFDDWCLMENLDQLLARLRRKIDGSEADTPHANKAKRPALLDSNVREKIAAANEADIAFFEKLKRCRPKSQRRRLWFGSLLSPTRFL